MDSKIKKKNEKANKTFETFRARSDLCAEIKKSCFMLSDEASEQGDTRMAKALSIVGNEYKKLLTKANEDAANQIFYLNNLNKSVNEIDLHGLFVSEAIEKLELRVACAKHHGKNFLVVIVGRGRHSSNGPKIKPAVIEFAKRNQIQFIEDSPNPGCITYKFKRKIATKRSRAQPRSISPSRAALRPYDRPTQISPYDHTIQHDQQVSIEVSSSVETNHYVYAQTERSCQCPWKSTLKIVAFVVAVFGLIIFFRIFLKNNFSKLQ